MEIVNVTNLNNSYLKIETESGILQEIKEYFTFFAPNYKFHPKYKAKQWDGKICLVQGKKIYAGLLSKLQDFSKSREYQLNIDSNIQHTNDVSFETISKFVDELNIHSNGEKLEKRDYQIHSVFTSIKNKRRILLSPTSSGKSYVIYCIIRWLIEHNKRILLIVPNIGLVKQMFSDFDDYSSENNFDIREYVQMIAEGATRDISKPIAISTYQSLLRVDTSTYFNSNFDSIIVDEVHLAEAKTIRSIMESATDVEYRFGLTGTLNKAKTHELVIQGLFGDIEKIISTRELIDKGYISDVNIKCIVLEYSNKEEKALVKSMKYSDEAQFLSKHEKRNKLLAKLAIESKGNTLILCNYVEHTETLYNIIKEKVGDSRKVFLITGKVDGDIRNDMRGEIEKENDAILVATFGTTSTGVSIKRLNNIIAASSTKSLIRLLQSIGRGLRKAHDKTKFTWFDIVDAIYVTKSKQNYSYKHFIERLEIYNEQEFEYKLFKIKF